MEAPAWRSGTDILEAMGRRRRQKEESESEDEVDEETLASIRESKEARTSFPKVLHTASTATANGAGDGMEQSGNHVPAKKQLGSFHSEVQHTDHYLSQMEEFISRRVAGEDGADIIEGGGSNDSGQRFVVTETSHPIPQLRLKSILEAANGGNDFALLVKQIRKEFVAITTSNPE
ncbi:hypothetical protein KIPB_001621 [Kipferlia bialata]|uniref:Uncharacterized protein n=1 Tax=Kipferlia bialata TaxID=797122 RepID=A0A9K3CP84_9EUKA|nr:hypothetical protein KIPB_001621 [Kipferlia bialata]|eukprot:g1621.t1